LYRTLQESLTNIVKHSKASQVWVELSMDEQKIILTIQDNGVGFIESNVSSPKGMGVSGLRERLALVGGELIINSAPTKGTIISAQLPLEETVMIV
jgi:signal transduction histidine kinase